VHVCKGKVLFMCNFLSCGRSTLSSLPLPPPPPLLEDNIGSGLLDDLENLGLDFDIENNGDASPTDQSLIAPPESE